MEHYNLEKKKYIKQFLRTNRGDSKVGRKQGKQNCGTYLENKCLFDASGLLCPKGIFQ